MEVVHNIPFFCILFTMACGVITSILSGKNAYKLVLFSSSLCFILHCFLLVHMYYQPQSVTFLMGHFSAPWGNEIRFGPFEVLMSSAFSMVMVLSLLTGTEKIFSKAHETKVNMYFLMMNLLLSSTFALVYTNDLFTAYVFLEINTLCSCGFVAAKNTRKAIAATIKYLIMSLLGSGLFLMSIIILYVLTGQLLMPNVKESIDVLMAEGSYAMPITIIVGLMSVSIAIKSALFPFHNWVPNAYDRAFNLSNALSSGIVLKSYIVLLIKIFYRVFGLENIVKLEILNIFLLFGVMSMLFASLEAVREDNVKKMLSLSSIAQIGYIYVGISLGTTAGFLSAAYTIIGHSMMKSMLFLACEGLMEVSDNSKSAESLRGSAYVNPMAGLAFGVGTLSMIGFPLFSGFYGKFLLALASAASSARMWLILGALILSTLLNAIYFLRVVQSIYGRTEGVDLKPADIPKRYQWSMGLFILVNLAIGLTYGPVTKLITDGLALL